MSFSDEEELLQEDDIMITDEFKNVTSDASSSPSESSDDSLYEPEEKSKKYSVIPLHTKIAVTTLAQLHPTWNLNTLRKKGSHLLKRKDQLMIWKKDVEKVGTLRDKLSMIDRWTYDRFEEARNNLHNVTTRMLQQWALTASIQHGTNAINFVASRTWTNEFKKSTRLAIAM